MNKQEKNIVDILTFDEIEDIVNVFIHKLYNTDKTVALISNKYLIEYAMEELLADDDISVRKVELELGDDIEYMISVDDYGNMAVQPIEYYDDKYFTGIEYAFVDMDGIVGQMTIDRLLDRDIPVVLFGCDDEECECDECGCAYYKDEKPVTTTSTSKSIYKVNGKEVTKDEFDKKYAEFEDKYLDNVRDMLLDYCDFMDEVNEWRKLFRW